MRPASILQWREFLFSHANVNFYTVDPGAHAIALELVPLARQLGNFSGWFAGGWSASHGVDCRPATELKAALNANGTLLLSSQTDYLRTQLILREAAMANVVTIFVFDHWKNYAEHFGGQPLPDVVVVPDHIAQQQFIEAVGEHAISRLRVLPHPGIDAAAERLTASGIEFDPNIVALLLDPTEPADGLGYDWRSTLAAAFDVISMLPGVRLMVKPHPRQNVDAVVAEISTLNGNKLLAELYIGETEPLIRKVGEVWGMTTSALHIALAVGKPIRSFQIGRNSTGLRASNSHIEPFVLV